MARTVILALALALAAAGCGGEAETQTVTVTETVPPQGRDHPAYQLSADVCGALPRGLVAPFLGVSPADADALAREYARLARPELREPAYEGCLEALEAER